MSSSVFQEVTSVSFILQHEPSAAYAIPPAAEVCIGRRLGAGHSILFINGVTSHNTDVSKKI